MAFPDHLLDDGERVASHSRPHWRSCLRPAAVLPLVAAAAGFGAGVVRSQPWAPYAWAVLAALAVLAAVRWTVLPIARWRCTHLVVTGTRLVARDGIVATRSVEVPVDRIDAVRVHAGSLERLLGAGTLLVEAAGERYVFADVPAVERVQARLHREIGRSAERARAAYRERLRDGGRAPEDRPDPGGAARDTMAGWGTARAVPERTAS